MLTPCPSCGIFGVFDKCPGVRQSVLMRNCGIYLLCGLLGLAGTGCGRHNPDGSNPASKSTVGPTDAEIPVSMNEKVQVVEITADDTMHFNGNRFTVHAGQPVRIELINKGTRPATEMAHNFILLKSGTDPVAFNLACAPAKDQQYLPASVADQTITHTSLAGPGQMVSTSFEAPQPGQYTFLCNFPGHYAIGMHGTMMVVP